MFVPNTSPRARIVPLSIAWAMLLGVAATCFSPWPVRGASGSRRG